MENKKEHICENCQDRFTRRKDKSQAYRFCSHKCYGNWLIGKKHSVEQKEKMRKIMTGRKFSKESLNKMSISQSNRSEEHLKNLSISQRGEKGSNWRGGISPLREKIRKSGKYISWRNKVFKRDNFTCQKCGKYGGIHHPHHIKSFSSLLDKYCISSVTDAFCCKPLWDINNGITLCIQCHKETETYGAKKHG